MFNTAPSGTSTLKSRRRDVTLCTFSLRGSHDYQRPVDHTTTAWRKTSIGHHAVVALLAGCTTSAQRPHLVEGIKFNMGGWWVVNFHVSSSAGSDSLVFNLSL